VVIAEEDDTMIIVCPLDCGEHGIVDGLSHIDTADLGT
jgi:hypothetical protein